MRIYIFLFSLTFFFFACKQEPKPNSEGANKEDENTVYVQVEEMPMFPGCSDLKKEEQRACAGKKMFTYVRENLKYPEAAKADSLEGRAVVSFEVQKDGSIKNAQIVSDPGKGMGAEALRVVESFPNWIPGKKDGKEVIVKYNIPVRFSMK